MENYSKVVSKVLWKCINTLGTDRYVVNSRVALVSPHRSDVALRIIEKVSQVFYKYSESF